MFNYQTHWCKHTYTHYTIETILMKWFLLIHCQCASFNFIIIIIFNCLTSSGREKKINFIFKPNILIHLSVVDNVDGWLLLSSSSSSLIPFCKFFFKYFFTSLPIYNVFKLTNKLTLTNCKNQNQSMDGWRHL